MAGLDDLEYLTAELLGEVVEKEGLFGPLAAVFGEEDGERGSVGVNDLAVGADDNASASEGCDDFVDETVSDGELLVPPAVTEGGAKFFEPSVEMEKLFVGECTAGDAFVEEENADKRIAVQDRDSDGAAEGVKFTQDVSVGDCFRAGIAEDTPVVVQVFAEAAPEREGELLEYGRLVANALHGVERAIIIGDVVGLAQEDDGAVGAECFADLLDGLLEKGFRVETMDKQRGKAAETVELVVRLLRKVYPLFSVIR